MESPEMIPMGDRKKVGMDRIAIALAIMENSLCFFSSVLLFCWQDSRKVSVQTFDLHYKKA